MPGSEQTLPVIVGVGEVCEAVPEDLREASSPIALAARAARRACDDALSLKRLASEIDYVAAVRTFADTAPQYAHPFGSVRNVPRAVAARLGVRPRRAVYANAGGDSPQALVGEVAIKIARGDIDVALLVGAEAQASAKAAMRADIELDWRDDTGGQLEDRGIGLAGIMPQQLVENDVTAAGAVYALLENARRAHLGYDRERYAAEIGRLLAPFSRVAAEHPCAMFSDAYNAEEVVKVTDKNPLLFEPYTKAMMAKDGVNQGAAVLLTSVANARRLGIDESRWVYLHGFCHLRDRLIPERDPLWQSAAMRAAYRTALERTGIGSGELAVMDVYSCFPIAVFEACGALGMTPQDPSSLTATGGMPYFGGPGNNYSMHGIVNVVAALRRRESGYGLVGANGGFLSKHAVGIYSRSAPREPVRANDEPLQAAIDGAAVSPQAEAPNGSAVVETYTVSLRRGEPERGFIIGRLQSGARFIGSTEPGDAQTPRRMLESDPLGESVHVTRQGPGNRFRF